GGGINTTKIENRKKKRRERKWFKHTKSCLKSSPGVVTAQDASPDHKSQIEGKKAGDKNEVEEEL
ncbi:hypothetical protein J6590_096275, partial [Homalodisca vitripennis]